MGIRTLRFSFTKNVKHQLSRPKFHFETKPHFGQCPLAACFCAGRCVCVLGLCLGTVSVLVHPISTATSTPVLCTAHTGHAKGTVLSFETALLGTPETNKRNSTSSGSMFLATVHFTLYLPGECTAFCHSQPEEEKEAQREWKE